MYLKSTKSKPYVLEIHKVATGYLGLVINKNNLQRTLDNVIMSKSVLTSLFVLKISLLCKFFSYLHDVL